MSKEGSETSEAQPAAYYSYEAADRHQRLWSGVWARVIWVQDAGANVLAVIHWMGGGYKVVGRYLRDEERRAVEHAQKCSGSGYCQTTADDGDGYREALANERKKERPEAEMKNSLAKPCKTAPARTKLNNPNQL